MVERFYLPGTYEASELALEGAEAHHLAHVLRLGPGAEVKVFNGQGREATAEVASVAKRTVLLRARSVVDVPDPALEVIVAVAPPKGDRFRWLVEKATELGVSRVVPLLTQRTVVDPREGKLEKLRQIVIAACKQCGRNRLMEVSEPTPFVRLLAGASDEDRVLLHPGAGPGVHHDGTRPLTLLIGPEGGFTDEEVEHAAGAGARIASLGTMILRTETAAIAAASVAQFAGRTSGMVR